MSEKQTQREILLALGSRPDVRMFKNPQGFFVSEQGWRITYGLHPGSSDLIGFRTLTILPEHVGRRVAVFVGAEIKTESGRVRPNQLVWQSVVRNFGGIAEVLRSTDDARLITEWEPR